MSPKVIIIGAIITLALLFGGLFFLSRPGPKITINPQATGQLTAGESFYDFGSVAMAKGLVSHKFTLTNSDSVPAVVTKIYSSCMCTKGTLTIGDRTYGPYGMPGHVAVPGIAAEIAPGQTAQLEVIFDPAAHGPAGVGKIERTVTAELNGQSPLNFNFSANVTP